MSVCRIHQDEALITAQPSPSPANFESTKKLENEGGRRELQQNAYLHDCYWPIVISQTD